MEMTEQSGNSIQNDTRFTSLDYMKIAVLGFALTAVWSSLHSIVLPLRLLDFVAESQKNTYLGILTFAGLILAMTTQPVVGAISDRSSFTWGRRRPYILLGVMVAIPFLLGIGVATSYAVLFTVYCLLQISSNTAQSPYQAFIPDLVPQNKRGLASGVKSLLEVLGGVALVRLVAYFMGRYVDGEGGPWLWLSLGVLAVILSIAMVITILTVKERRQTIAVRLSLLSTLLKSFKLSTGKNRNFLLFLLSRAVMGIPGVVLQIYTLYYLMDVVGIANPATVAADLIIVVGVSLIATVFFAGRLSDKTGRKPVVVFSGLLGALSIALLYFSRIYLHIMICGALLGIANGALLSSSWALATDLVVKGEEARYLGLMSLALAGGSALARLMGPVIDVFNNINSGLGYQVMLLVCFLCFIIGTLLVIRIRQPQPAIEYKEVED